MGCGIALGYVCRGRGKTLKFVQPSISIAIFVLLFLLGLSVGADARIMDNLGKIGWDACWMTLGAVAGSAGCAWVVYRCFFRGRRDP